MDAQKKPPLTAATEQEGKDRNDPQHTNIVSKAAEDVKGAKPIDYIRQQAEKKLEIALPDEVFRPALEKAMYKALSAHIVLPPLFLVSMDWLAEVVSEEVQMDLLSVLRKNEMEEKINGME